MKLLKSADDYYEIGYNYLNQKEYQKAYENFVKASEKYQKLGDIQHVNLCISVMRLLIIQSDINNPDYYTQAKDSLEKLDQNELKFGLRCIQISDLITECQLKTDEILALQLLSSETYDDGFALAENLRNIGNKYQKSINENILFIPEIFQNNIIRGSERAYLLYAVSEEILAELMVWKEPKKAVEHYQLASHWRNLLGQKEDEIKNNKKIQDYSERGKCWCCGREVYGKNIHFLHMKTQISDFQLDNEKSEVIRSLVPGEQKICVCRVCYYAISYRIDEIAKEYHKKAVQEIQDAEARLNQRINSLAISIRR